MSEGFALPHGGFRAPRVPFDLRCVILAGLGYLATLGVDLLLGKAWGVESPVAQMVALIASNLVVLGAYFGAAMEPLWGLEPFRLDWWQAALTAFCFLFVWSFFGAALLRTAAVKLTRDEPVSFKEALRFGGSSLITYLLAPTLVLLFAGVLVGLNTVLGFLMNVPILPIPLFPLSLLCSLMIVVSLAGGLIGLPLMWAGISVEQNGALEAMSRAFSYIFARPLQFFFGYFLVFAMMSVILVVGVHFEDVAKETVKLGIIRDPLDSLVSRDPGGVDVLEEAFNDADRVQRERAGISDIRNSRDARWYDWPGFLAMWFFLGLFMLGFKGFALYFLLGGTASLYLHLRRDVDGTDEREIYPESEEDYEEPGVVEPRWVAPDAPPEPAAEPESTPEPEAEPDPPAAAAPPAKKPAAKKKKKKRVVKKKKKKKKTGE